MEDLNAGRKARERERESLEEIVHLSVNHALKKWRLFQIRLGDGRRS
jgi:hypothetical protein